jgi:hypothetical protein
MHCFLSVYLNPGLTAPCASPRALGDCGAGNLNYLSISASEPCGGDDICSYLLHVISAAIWMPY